MYEMFLVLDPCLTSGAQGSSQALFQLLVRNSHGTFKSLVDQKSSASEIKGLPFSWDKREFGSKEFEQDSISNLQSIRPHMWSKNLRQTWTEATVSAAVIATSRPQLLQWEPQFLLTWDRENKENSKMEVTINNREKREVTGSTSTLCAH